MTRATTRHEDTDPAPRPAYSGRLDHPGPPDYSFPESGVSPEEAYRHVHDEHMLDGNARLNLATFVTTWMEPEAEDLMAEAFATNAIDHDEYPSTSAMEQRSVAMIADLFHAPGLDPGDAATATGVSTVGSSEAVMLAGLALKWRWRAAHATPGNLGTPNLVLGSNVQVVWEKFCRYFDVEPRYVPITAERTVVDPGQIAQRVDENTIGVVGILGTTFTGEFEDIAGICTALDRLAASGGPDVPVHVDAASGGFVAPFTQPDLEWDFRLPRVVSINASGHKYGLTYPGIGFAVWRDKACLPEELVFHVNYLGGDMPTFTLNFSRPGNQIVGQYYNLLRLGRDGYTEVMASLCDTATWVSGQLTSLGFRVVGGDGSELPVVAVRLDEPGFSVYDVSHELRAKGWQVPAYPLPDDATDVHVLRIVVREGFSGDLAEAFMADVREVLAHLRDAGGHVGHEKSFAH